MAINVMQNTSPLLHDQQAGLVVHRHRVLHAPPGAELLQREAVDEAGSSPAERLRAIIHADFSPRIATEKKIAVWYAFWAESRARASYRKLCAELYNDYYWQVRNIVQELIDAGDYDHVDAHQVTLGLNAMTDGMWLDLQIQPGDFNRDEARRTIEFFLRQLFPAEFGDGSNSRAMQTSARPS
jgi:TetR/AcrR family transcriptional regulator, transcriptional repressor of bet genes